MATTDPNPEPVVQSLERYRLRLGFWQAIWGTLISGGVAVAIPAAVDAYKAQLDLRKAEQEVALKQKEIESKAQDLHQTYISKFIDTALNQDIELRLRFSEYFSYVSEKESREQWKQYHDGLEKRRNEIRLSINDKETRVAHLGALSKPTEAEQIELWKFKRELEWNYAEVGYARQDSNITIPNVSSSISRLDPKAMMADNEQLFAQAIIDPRRLPQLQKIIDKIKTNKERYQSIEAKTNVPWYLVGLVHYRCCGNDFSTHLNGEPLSRRTVLPPAGRPLDGDPPFAWEDSAVDMVRFYGWQGSEWSVGTILYKLEGFNGYGYRVHNVRSPYIWGCTNLYVSGKFVGGSTFDPDLVDTQCGTGALLKLLVDQNIAQLP